MLQVLAAAAKHASPQIGFSASSTTALIECIASDLLTPFRGILSCTCQLLDSVWPPERFGSFARSATFQVWRRQWHAHRALQTPRPCHCQYYYY